MEITSATLDDARAIAEVHVLSWRHAYRELLPTEYLASLSVEAREAMWSDCIAQGSAEVLLAKSAGQVCGFASFGASREDVSSSGTAELFAIYLAPHVCSTGVGRALLLTALQRMAAQGFAVVTLWVMANNNRAIRFYENAGFVAVPSSLKQLQLGGETVEELRYVRHTSG